MATSTMVGVSGSLTSGMPALGSVKTAARCDTCHLVQVVPGLRVSGSATLRKEGVKLESQFVPTFSDRISLKQRKASERIGHALIGARSAASDAEQLKSAREDVKKLLAEKKCHPILIRLGWHDSGSYDKNISEFPKRGGANGSIRFSPELGHGANAGLISAVKLLEPIKEKYPNITHADLYQLASATAIEEAGGPKIPMRYGRVETKSQEECAIEGNLPEAGPRDPSDHLRKVFYRMGLNDQEIVALSGAHTLGRSRPERSGWGKEKTKYTSGENGYIGQPGGQSWTVDWLKFDNSYFKDIKAQSDEDLLVLPTDKILTEDPEFKKFTDKYAESEEEFFKDYALAHVKLSELGSLFDPPQGFSIDEEPKKQQPVVEKFSAAKYSSGNNSRELSESMKEKIRAEYLAVGGSPDKPLSSNYFLNIIIAIAVLSVLASLATQS